MYNSLYCIFIFTLRVTPRFQIGPCMILHVYEMWQAVPAQGTETHCQRNINFNVTSSLLKVIKLNICMITSVFELPLNITITRPPSG